MLAYIPYMDPMGYIYINNPQQILLERNMFFFQGPG